MHLLSAQAGALQQDGEAIDLAQTPAPIIFASAADSELMMLAAAADRAGTSDLRLANLLRLGHNLSVDMWLDQTVRHARLVVIRLLGGPAYWPYGVDELTALALSSGPNLAILPGVERHPQIHAMPLWRHTAVLIVANDHPWAARESVRLAELHDQPMISREEGSNTRRITHAAMAKAGVRPRTVLELGSREAVCEAVGAGLGFSIIWELEASASTRFRTLHFRDAKITSSDYVACLKSESMRRSIKAFFAVAAADVI